MKKGLRRPTHTYVLYALWIALMCYSLTTNSSAFGQWTLRAMTFFGGLSFLHMIIKRNYLEVTNSKLIINRDFFRTTIVDLNQIEKVVTESGPFSPSTIILKNKRRIKYWHSETNHTKFKELMRELNIPVE